MVKTKKNMSSLAKRTLAALVMLPAVIGIVYAGYPLPDMFVLIVGSALSWEWAKMTAKGNHDIYVLSYLLALVASTLIYNTPMTIAFIAALTLFVWFVAKNEKRRLLITLGVVYISVGVGAMLWLYYLIGKYGLMWYIIVVCGVDIGGYIVGSNLKGPKLAPKISPNKTWSGLIGGIVLSAVLSVSYIATLDYIASQSSDIKDKLLFAGIAAVIAVVAQIGDLIESAIKRNVGVKDSSNLIPGHGGVFDRIDGMIFAAPLTYLFFALFFGLI